MTQASPISPEFQGSGYVAATGMSRIDFTTDEKRALTRVRAFILVQLPFFGNLLYNRLELVGTRSVPIAATDGRVIFINPDTFFKLSVQKQAFVICHEIVHCIWGHCTSLHVWKRTNIVVCPRGSLPFDQETMNMAMDYVINALLIAASTGEYDPRWLYDATMSKEGLEPAVEVYEKLWKTLPPPPPPPPGGGNSGDEDGDDDEGQSQPGGPGSQPNSRSYQPKNGQSSFDEHLKPGAGDGKNADEATAEREKNEAEWKVAVSAAARTAKAQGKLPLALERFIDDILQPKTTWQDRIKSAMHRRMGADSFDWTTLDEQMLCRDAVGYEAICFPSESSMRAGHLVVGVDTSGSIGPDELRRFFSEMVGIIEEVRPRQLTVIWCDAKVQRTDEMDEPEDLNQLRVTINAGAKIGGGGTSFKPVFDLIRKDQLEPDLFVYLTDTFGDFPSQPPKYPVVWGVIGDGKVPWGDRVQVEL